MSQANEVSENRNSSVYHRVGERIAWRRMMLGLSRGQLAEQIGKSARQVRRYERSAFRMSVGELFAVADALHAEVSFFLEDCFLEDGSEDGDKQTLQPGESLRATEERRHLDVLRLLPPDQRNTVFVLARVMAV